MKSSWQSYLRKDINMAEVVQYREIRSVLDLKTRVQRQGKRTGDFYVERKLESGL